MVAVEAVQKHINTRNDGHGPANPWSTLLSKAAQDCPLHFFSLATRLCYLSFCRHIAVSASACSLRERHKIRILGGCCRVSRIEDVKRWRQGNGCRQRKRGAEKRWNEAREKLEKEAREDRFTTTVRVSSQRFTKVAKWTAART